MISIKKRYVLIGKEIFKRNLSKDYSKYIINSGSEINDDLLISEDLKKKIHTRIQSDNIVLFCYVSNKQIIAYYWGICSVDRILWHDKFPIQPGDVLLFDAYVFSAYRGKGLYRDLIYLAHDYYISKKVKSIFTIVERSNESSFKSNMGSGLRIYSINFLLKIAKRNIFSIFIGRHLGVYFVFKNKKSKCF